jgi:hypothetical protein
MATMINPLPVYLGLLLGLLGIVATYVGANERRATIVVSGLLFLVAGAGLITLAVITA